MVPYHTRLTKLIDASDAKLKPVRAARLRFLKQYVGRFYNQGESGNEADKASPINLLYQGVTTLVPNLVYNDPRAQVQTPVLAFRDYADMLAQAVTHVATTGHLRMELRKAIVDAIFFAGFLKTGLAANGQVVQIEGTDMEVGAPFAERVDPDDMVLDPYARNWDEQTFVGNRYQADLEQLQEQGFADPDLLKQLAGSWRAAQKDRASTVGNTSGVAAADDVRQMVDLVDIFLPREGVILTLPYGREFSGRYGVLREVEYIGPKTGPYHMLGFAYVPDNILPVAPAGIWYDLHILANRVARKLARQADRNKRVLAYEDAAEEDVQTMASANDGETVRVSNLNLIREIELGGVSDTNYQWSEWVKRQFSEQAGSLDLLSGQGSSAPTATQASYLQANTSVRLSDMQGLVNDFASAALTDIAYYLHTDPLIELPLTRRVGGVEEQVFYSPEMRQGDFLDYVIRVDAYSMPRVDPQMAVRRRLEFITTAIPAAAQAAMMLGPGFDVGGLLTRMAKDLGINDADEWLNTPQIQQWVMQRMQLAMIGDPGKALGGGIPAQFNPAQPVPAQMGPVGGISPEQEQAAVLQEVPAEQQAALPSREPSAAAMAQQLAK